MEFFLTSIALVASSEVLKTAQDGIIGGRADGLLSKATSTFGKRLRAARERGQLPKNHHLERGTLRAALLASEVTLHEFLDAHGKEPLADWPIEDEEADGKNALDKAKDLFSRSYVGLTSLRNKLAVLTRNLEASDKDSSRSKKFDAALEDARLSPAGSAMDSFGLSALDAQNPAHVQEAHDPSMTIREAREQYLASLADEVMDQLIAFGNWPTEFRDKQIQETLRPFFFGPDERWAENFALCYAEEIRSDERLNKLAVLLRAERTEDALQTLKQGVEAVRAEVEAVAAVLEEKREGHLGLVRSIEANVHAQAQKTFEMLRAMSAQLQYSGQDVFFSPGMGSKSAAHKTFRPFHFSEEEDRFLGRDDGIEQLRETLLAKPQGRPDFRWAAVCGDAGSGKSRFALQVLKEFAGDWPVSGFVRRDFIRRADADLKSLSFLTGPTLLVIDYTGIMPQYCSRFIERCATLAKHSQFPVRLIVLVRRTNDRFFTEIDRGEDEELARTTQVQFDCDEVQEDNSRALVLGGFDRTDTVTLLKRRIERTREKDFGSKPMILPSDARLLEIVEGYDAKRRPLFILMIADALARGEIDLASRKTSSEEARLSLFWDYLTRQFDRRWRASRSTKSASEADRKAIDRHVSLAILSTSCRGLTEEGWERLLDHSKLCKTTRQLLPEFIDDPEPVADCSELDEDGLLANIVGSKRADPDEDPLPVLEPDLIGESLLLQVLGDRGANIAELDKTPRLRKRSLVEMAWVAEPADAAFFVLSCAENYPALVAEHGFLLPKVKRPEDAELRANLFASLASLAIQPLLRAAPTLGDVKFIEQVIDAFPFEVDASSEAQIEWSKALATLADHLAFMINRTSPPGESRLEKKLVDKLNAGKASLGAAANKIFDEQSETASENDDADEADPGDSDLEEEFYIPPEGDSATADAAIPVLRRAFDQSRELIFRDFDPRVRIWLAGVISEALGAVFWRNRAQRPHKGMASKAPSEEEDRTREEFISACQSRLSGEDLDEVMVALAARFQSSNMYADGQIARNLGEVEFKAIQSINRASGFTRLDLVSPVFFFLGNFSNTLVHLDHDIADSNRQALISEVEEAAKALHAQAREISTGTPRDARTISDGWFRVLAKIRFRDRLQGKDLKAELAEDLELHRQFSEKHSDLRLGRGSAEYFFQLLNGVGTATPGFDDFADAYLDLVERTDFDRRTYYVAAANAWPDLVEKLIDASETQHESVRLALAKSLKQIGTFALDALVNGILKKFPSADRSGDWMESLVDLAAAGEGPALSKDRRRRLESALAAQFLIDRREDEVHEQAQSLWTRNELDHRIDGLRRVDVMLELLDIADPRLVYWEDRIFKATMDLLTDSDSAILEGDKASYAEQLIRTASSIAEKQIIAGNSPDEWIELLEKVA